MILTWLIWVRSAAWFWADTTGRSRDMRQPGRGVWHVCTYYNWPAPFLSPLPSRSGPGSLCSKLTALSTVAQRQDIYTVFRGHRTKNKQGMEQRKEKWGIRNLFHSRWLLAAFVMSQATLKLRVSLANHVYIDYLRDIEASSDCKVNTFGALRVRCQVEGLHVFYGWPHSHGWGKDKGPMPVTWGKTQHLIQGLSGEA